jgi:hypothetical protein
MLNDIDFVNSLLSLLVIIALPEPRMPHARKGSAWKVFPYRKINAYSDIELERVKGIEPSS